MSVVIVTCTCKSEFQDKEHGNRRRVANVQGEKKKNEAHCTVCGKSHNVN